MKQQLKLNESELYNIIEGAVKNLVLEYLPYFDGKAAARGLEQGDTSPFERFMQNGLNRGWTKDDMTDFQSGIEAGSSVGKGKKIYDEDFEDLNDSPVNTAVDGSLEDDIAFEEGRRAVKVTESQLFDIIKESVNILLKEAISKNDLGADTYDGAKRFVPMSDKAKFARTARQQLNYFKKSGKTDKENTLRNNIRNQKARFN